MDGKIREEFLAYLRKLVTSGMLDDGVPEQFKHMVKVFRDFSRTIHSHSMKS